MRRFLQRQLKDRVSVQQRDRQLVFEQEKQALADTVKAREEDIRDTQQAMRKLEQAMQELEQKLRGLERENAADADKTRLLEANYDAAMGKLNRLLEGSVEFQRSAPGEVSGFPFAHVPVFISSRVSNL